VDALSEPADGVGVVAAGGEAAAIHNPSSLHTSGWLRARMGQDAVQQRTAIPPPARTRARDFFFLFGAHPKKQNTMRAHLSSFLPHPTRRWRYQTGPSLRSVAWAVTSDKAFNGCCDNCLKQVGCLTFTNPIPWQTIEKIN
jgi:hypothetical protein